MNPLKVILVEDDADDVELFVTFLQDRNDIELLPPVNNGSELIDYLQNVMSYNYLMPDLIILDQNMPKMNGKQTLEFLKSQQLFSKIPAVIYSTYNDTNLIVECKELGAVTVMAKPINEKGYQKMMDDLIEICSTTRIPS